ncbi:MAG TPA: helix-turn-helix transcriptional regulator [Trebonia sp.]|nr:helix-turn-helix transcriptional regulator [Trebonia sp.]
MKQVDGNSPLKVFGQMLTFFRNKASLSLEQLGALVYLSPSQLRKVEGGTRAPSDDLVSRCEAIPEMQCHGALRELYDSMVDYLKVGVFPGWFQGWPGKESAAVRLRVFGLVVIPGLLQTEAYARAILSTKVGATSDEIDVDVVSRLARQTVLGGDKPLEYWATIDEATLRRPVGSREIMREALQHLAEMARRPNTVIQVIQLEVGAHQGLNGGSFEIAEFEEAPDVAYQDAAVSGQIIEDQDAVRELSRTWDALQRVTLPETLSLRKIEETIAELWT